MDRFARFIVRRRRWVFVIWLVVFLAGGATASQLSGKLSYDFSLPGQEGYETDVKMIQAYGVQSFVGYVPVYQAADGSKIADHKADLAAVDAELAKIPGLRITDYASSGDQKFITDDGTRTFSLVYAPPVASFSDPLQAKVEAATRSAAAQHGLSVKVTGYQQLSSSGGDSGGPNVLVETLIGALGALVVLVFVFASFLALVPLMVAAVSILSTFLVVLGLTTFTDVSFVVQFLISLVGLGVAIDYSLLVVSRWREERAKGATNEDAVATAVRTAGHAVLASGVTVAISLVALVVVNVPLIRSMGFGGMLIPLVSTTVVLTLLPAFLGAVGPRVDWPRIRHEGEVARGWAAWARTVIRFRWVAAGLAVVALGVAISPVFSLQIGQSSSSSLSSSGEAHDALVSLGDGGVGTGVLTPMSLMVKPGADAQSFATAAAAVPGVLTATLTPPGRGGVSEVIVIPDRETDDNNSVAVVTAVRNAVKGRPGYDGLAGQGATVLDYQRAVYAHFPYVVGLIALVTFVLLARTFRSLLLPLKAVILNLLSVSAVFGLSTWFWQQGHGSNAIFGIQGTGAMTFWLPVLIFAFLFGLSMDYEVFILSRMREEYDRTGSTAYAVEQGLGRTGRLVTSAALILFFAFAALTSAPSTDIKVFATALGVGILLDATVVRALLVPALVSLFGQYNWWLPPWAGRILRVEPSPLRPDTPKPTADDPGPTPDDDRDRVSV